jgi:uncharacterized membrane protein YebE (DUF533 family)
MTMLVGATTLATGYASAQTAVKDPVATPRIDHRQAHQQARINEGVVSGKITPAEQATLQTEQNKIAATKAAAKADGVVTHEERRALRQAQKHEGRKIARHSHGHKHEGHKKHGGQKGHHMHKGDNVSKG